MKEIGKYQSKEGEVRVLLAEEQRMLCDVTIEELTKILGLKSKKNIEMIISRNPRITTEKFSRIELMNTAGGIQETRLFTERGIVEVAFLAGTKKAEKFRDEIYDLLVSLREKNMISFGANGLDVKLLEQVKESNEKLVGITEEMIDEAEKLNTAFEKESDLEEKLNYVAAMLGEFMKDRETIKNAQFFNERLEENEIEIINIKKELKKISETLDKINKKMGGK